MTELPPYVNVAHDWVAGYVDDSHPVRDEATHALIRKLTGLLAPAPGEHVAIESYYEPSANAWRIVAHRVPVIAPTPEDEEARRRAVLEEALSDPEGRALAEAILERKRIAAELENAAARAARAAASARPIPDYVQHLPADDAEAELRILARQGLTRGTGEAFA